MWACLRRFIHRHLMLLTLNRDIFDPRLLTSGLPQVHDIPLWR